LYTLLGDPGLNRLRQSKGYNILAKQDYSIMN